MRYPAINKKRISSMRNALRLLSLFTMDEPELNLSQLAGKLEVGLSTAYRLTNTLIYEGFIIKDPHTKCYRLATSILGMGTTIISQIDICHIAMPILEKLVSETGETAHLSILKGNQVVYLHKVESNHPVHLLSHTGKQNPFHCTSSGQVILAYQQESKIEKVLDMGLASYTTKTITSEKKMRKLLSTIRNQGFAISKEEMHEGVISIAAPITDIAGNVIASLSIAGPTSRISSLKIPILVKVVKKLAKDASEHLIFLNGNNHSK